MGDGEYLSVQQLAEQLGCAPDDALHLVRRVGPRGVIRTTDRRFLIPATAVGQLRAALNAGRRKVITPIWTPHG